MTVRIVAFARARELLGSGERSVTLAAGARVEDAWLSLATENPAIAAMRSSVRVARNGRIANFGDGLSDGDELALLPPVGGG